MLHQLRARLSNAGFPAINFFIISSADSINDTEGLILLQNTSRSIPVLQEPVGGSLWDNVLEGAQNHILVIDRCGRMSYQVILPWSLLNFPYVKAAILSTYSDDPCGYCVYNTLASANVTKEQNVNVDTNSTVPYVMNSDLPLNTTATQNTGRPVEDTTQNNTCTNTSRPGGNIMQVTKITHDVGYTTGASIDRPMEDTTHVENTRANTRRPLQNSIQVTNRKHDKEITIRTSVERLMEDPAQVNNIRAHIGRTTVSSSPAEEHNAENQVSDTTQEGEESERTTIGTLEETVTQKPKHKSKPKKTRPHFPRKRKHKTKQETNKHHVVAVESESTKNASQAASLVENPDLNIENRNSLGNVTLLELDNPEQQNRTKLEIGDTTSVVEEDVIIKEDGTSGSLVPLTVGADGTLPIRVIMHAPHTHHNGEQFHENQYLVLQTSNPGYHGHLTATDRTRKTSGNTDLMPSVPDGADSEERDIDIGDNIISQESAEGDSRERKRNKATGRKKNRWVTRYYEDHKTSTNKPLYRTNADEKGTDRNDDRVKPIPVTWHEQKQKVQKYDDEEPQREQFEEVNVDEDTVTRGSGKDSNTRISHEKSEKQKTERGKLKQGEEKHKNGKHSHRIKTPGQNKHKQSGKYEGTDEEDTPQDNKQFGEPNEDEDDTITNPTEYNNHEINAGRNTIRIGGHKKNRESDESINDDGNRLSREEDEHKQLPDINLGGEFIVERRPITVGQSKNIEDSKEDKEDSETAGARDRIIVHYSKLLPWINFQM